MQTPAPVSSPVISRKAAPGPRAARFLATPLATLAERATGKPPSKLRRYASRLRLAAAELSPGRPLFTALFQDLAVAAELEAERREQRRCFGAPLGRSTHRALGLTGLAKFSQRGR
jgi:hypothetical protein